jgi:hypothetical protein
MYLDLKVMLVLLDNLLLISKIINIKIILTNKFMEIMMRVEGKILIITTIMGILNGMKNNLIRFITLTILWWIEEYFIKLIKGKEIHK